jgi:Holliday junction resolvasome RuvABC endonuclease subunit
MSTRYAIGIDPSLSGTAVCILDQNATVRMHRFTSKPAFGVSNRIRRYAGLVADVCTILDSLQGAPVASILIEGYAFGAMQKAHELGEYGGLLRRAILRRFPEEGILREVPPTTLKQFVSGAGNCPKDQMGAHVAKRWGEVFRNNDEVDAFALAKLALCVAGMAEPATAWQRTAVDTVLHGKPKKPRKKKPAADDNF